MWNDRIFLHVGLHKTGSTFLQRRIFPQLQANLNIQQDMSYLATSDNFNPDVFHKIIQAGFETTDHQATIISQEALSGRSDGNPMWDPYLIAERLKRSFPDGRVILIFRDQRDYILSLYAFRVVRRGFERRTLSS